MPIRLAIASRWYHARRRLPLTLVILALGACGKIGFDSIGAASGTTDAHMLAGDGAMVGGVHGDAPNDGAVAPGDGVGTCASPIALAYGQTLSNLSIAGATDMFDTGCGPGLDSVFVIALPSDVALADFHVTADFDGTIEGIGDVCPTPPPPSGCAQFHAYSAGTLGRPLTAGTHYVFVQKVSGAGVTFSMQSM